MRNRISYAILLSAAALMGGSKVARQKMYRCDGSANEEIVRAVSGPHGLVLDVAGGKLYWPNLSDGRIRRADLSGSNVEILASGLPFPLGIAIHSPDGPIPAANEWGLVVFALIPMIGAKLYFGRRETKAPGSTRRTDWPLGAGKSVGIAANRRRTRMNRAARPPASYPKGRPPKVRATFCATPQSTVTASIAWWKSSSSNRYAPEDSGCCNRVPILIQVFDRSTGSSALAVLRKWHEKQEIILCRCRRRNRHPAPSRCEPKR